jgi:hypothetical protein
VLAAIEHAPGAVPGTAWGAYNGVTYYQDHMAGRSADLRLHSSWRGTGAKNKSTALKSLYDFALAT